MDPDPTTIVCMGHPRRTTFPLKAQYPGVTGRLSSPTVDGMNPEARSQGTSLAIRKQGTGLQPAGMHHMHTPPDQQRQLPALGDVKIVAVESGLTVRSTRSAATV